MATTGASLKPIYEQINSAPQYHPLTADTFGDWSMEAGDLVTVTRDGNSYQSPVNSTKMTWKKGQQITISSEGSEKRDPVTKVSQRKYRGGGSSLRNSQYQHIFVEDTYKQLKAGLELTTSTAQLYVQDSYNKLRAALEMTSSTAQLYVRDAYKQLQSGLAATSSAAMLYASSAENVAKVVARINSDGSSSMDIHADKIKLDGTSTSIQDIITVRSGSGNSVTIKANPIAFGTSLSNMINMANGVVSAHGFAMMGPGSAYTTIDGTVLNGMIKEASVSGNTLTLKKFNGDQLTFSKATSLSGQWSSGKLTVTASPQNEKFERTLVAGAASKSNGWITIPIRAQWGASGQYEESTGWSAQAYIPNLFSTMNITRAVTGVSNVGQVSYYGKLYFWNSLTNSYQAASDSNQYWYHSGTNLSGTTTVYH